MKIPLLFYSKENCINVITALKVKFTAIRLLIICNHPGFYRIYDARAAFEISGQDSDLLSTIYIENTNSLIRNK